MIASAIAYLLTALFALFGLGGLFMVANKHPITVGQRGYCLTASFGFLALAWLCVYLGGI